MSSSAGFFTISEMSADRAFWRNLILSVLAVAAIGYGIALGVTSGKLKVAAIGAVKIMDKPINAAGRAVKPISEIATDAKVDKASDPEYAGYVVNFEDLCKVNEYPIPLDPSVILIEAPDGSVTAATTKVGPKTCAIIRSLVGKKQDQTTIYAASDSPFSGIKSDRKYVILKASAAGPEGALLPK
jgi:hypothetical protein